MALTKQRGERSPGLSIAPTIPDRIAAYLNPQWGVERLRARVQLGAVESFTGASVTRRSLRSWFTTRKSADADLLPDLPRLRDRSTDLVRNNPMAAGAINGTVTSVVGTGLTCEPTIDAEAVGLTEDQAAEWQKVTKREFKLWADSTDCDLTRHQDFYGLQDLVFRSSLEKGDAITILPYKSRQGSVYDLRVQIVEAERLSNPSRKRDTPALAGGVEMDADGAPVAYWLTRQHPGGIAGTTLQWDRYEAYGPKTGRRNVLHHFRRVRAGQTRGIPYLAPVIEIIKQLGRYTDAEVMAAVVSGLFTVFITSEGAQGIGTGIPGMAAETGALPTDNDIKLGNGNVVDLAPGEKVEAPNPGRPNPNFDPFFQACVRQMGIALEVPFEVLIKHFTASYTAARAAILEAWKFYMGRRAWLVQSFCDPIYEAWMDEAVAAGRIRAPGYFADPSLRRAWLGVTWHGDAMPQVDPVKEVEAARQRVDGGFSDRARETAMLTGADWETTHKQQVREQKMRVDGGLAVAPVVAPPLGSAQNANGVPEDGGSDTSDDKNQGDSGDGSGDGEVPPKTRGKP